MKIKSNGHSVCTKLIKRESLQFEIGYYLEKFKFPINISVNEVKNTQDSMESNWKTSLENNNSYSANSGETDYDVSVLSEQVILFESDKQIDDYIATEKLLAHDV